MSDQTELDDKLKGVREAFAKWETAERQRHEDFWNSLSKEDQLNAFCYVIRKLYEGEIEEGRSYRGMLYDVFGFGMESYVTAQISGFLEIHNRLGPDE